jgi:putative transposase
MILKLMNISVGRWYGKRKCKAVCEKRGPKVKYSDGEVLSMLEKYLSDPIFYNEGYKKLTVRLREMGCYVGKERLRRIMNEQGLLLNGFNRERVSPYEHTGVLLTDRPNKMWGSDIKEFHLQHGTLYFISLKDHFHGKIVGHYVSQDKTSKSTIEALRQAIKNEFGCVSQGVCSGMDFQIRQDNGSQYVGREYKAEAIFLGVSLSNTMVRSPQSNGVIERFHRTMNEQLGILNKQTSFEASKDILDKFVIKYNDKWLYHKNKLKSPLSVINDIGYTELGEGVPPTRQSACRHH